MTKFRNILLIGVLALTVAACKTATVIDTKSVQLNTSTSTDTSVEAELAQKGQQNVSCSQAPGPYQTIEKDSEQCKQGRFPPGSHGGKLVVATVSGEPKTVNPWVAEDALSQEMSNLMFRGLGDIDEFTGEIIPDLAVEIKEEPDHLTYTTTLRKGLRWSDGEPISADDVAFTWNTIVAQGFGNPNIREAALVDGNLPVCTVEGELTNKFVCSKPSYPFKRVLATIRIAPKHVIEPVVNSRDSRADFQKLWAFGQDQSHMVSNGPFSLVDFAPGERVEFARASSFYMIDKNGSTLPYLDRLVYIIQPEAGSVVLSFGKKEADIAQFRPKDKSWIESQQKEQNSKVYDLGPASVTTFLVFNMNQRTEAHKKKNLVDLSKKEWFNDLNFRQAINHVIDRKAVIDSFYKGAASQIVSTEPSSSPYFNKALKAIPVNLKEASALLSKSGFVQKADACYDKNGKKVEFTLSYLKASKFYQSMAEQIVKDLKTLGITVTLDPVETAAAQDLLLARKAWEAQLCMFSADPLEPSLSSNLYKSTGRLHLFDQREADWKGNIVVDDIRPWEKQIDDIYDQAASEFDKEKRKALFFESQKLIYEQAPFIYLISPDVVLGARNTVRNYCPTPLAQASYGLHNVEEVYIDLSQQPQEKPAENKQ